MLVTIPRQLKKELNTFSKVLLESYGENSNAPLISNTISKLHIERMDFINLHDNVWQNCASLQFRGVYENGRDKIFDFDNKNAAKYVSPHSAEIAACLRVNEYSKYEDTVAGRKECLEYVGSLIHDNRLSDVCVGDKNLIYYTVYFNKGYIELFNLSVESIVKNSKEDFDILVITDFATQKIIEKTNCAKLKNLKYFITETPVDGVDASKMKINIYKYPNILDYSNVLFLDCDIVAQANIDDIFNKETRRNTLYTVKNKNLGFHHLKTIHHGFTCLSDEFIEEMRLGSQFPFNAGQFLFKTSPIMLKHFENIRWFMDNWPSEYFFEQCFMCYYFCRGYLTNMDLLKPFIGINSTNDSNITDDDLSKKALIHFIAPPLNAAKKLEYIQNYLVKFQKPSLLKRVKNLFK
jgi:hypothetical protein